jgi:tetratricopeptide (TPR) repeat protein
MQRPVEALEAYRKSGAVLDALATTRPRAVNLIVIGQVQSDLARQDEARQALVAGRQLAVAIGDRRLEAIADLGLAKIMTRRGEYQAALEVFQPAVERLDVMGDDLWLATGLLGIAEIATAQLPFDAGSRRWRSTTKSACSTSPSTCACRWGSRAW